jgi:hypothetical protein
LQIQILYTQKLHNNIWKRPGGPIVHLCCEMRGPGFDSRCVLLYF